MRDVLTLDYFDDESLRFSLNGVELMEVNHDYDGWKGMERIRAGFLKAAEVADWKINVVGDVNV